MLIRRTFWMFLAVFILPILACWNGEPSNVSDELTEVGLPVRETAPDLSAVTEELRQNGGPAYIYLTGVPNQAVIADLESLGVSGISSYPELKRVAGELPAGSVEIVAARLYVTKIEPADIAVPRPTD